MYYYSVLVRSHRYHGKEPLTYSSDNKLPIGQIVQVELQKQPVLGVVSGSTTKPRFQTKPIIDALNLPPVPPALVKTASWLTSYYPAPLGIITQQLLPATLSKKRISNISKTILNKPKYDKLPPLTKEQAQAVEGMLKRNTYLLHGVTGSGKTRIYIELAKQAIEQGKSVIILTPEISLTSQLQDKLTPTFGDRVVVMHSQQTPTERETAWLKCLVSKKSLVVIGPRSALFSPVKHLGLIVIDESHESAYKQEQAPQYQTGRVAAYLASQTQSFLILGSATPSVNDYYLAQQKNKPIIKLTSLATSKNAKKTTTTIDIIDKKDFSNFTTSPILSQQLIDSIKKALSKNEQTLLYLNRRGTARLVMCENCGWQATCPHCDLPLTYHNDSHKLHCHSCSYSTNAPISCPDCNNPTIIFKTAGTKAVHDEALRLFPNAKISRFDTDNTKAERFEKHYQDVQSGNVDILIGTQLLAKGLDLPKLSTLGVILADTSLYMPDFSAQERTFQLINQVLGRIGRGHVNGKAIIQTYHPRHPILQYAIDKNYDAFYKSELISRKKFIFPPFCYLLKTSTRRASLQSTIQATDKLKEHIIGQGLRVQIEGPAPAFHERIQGKYQWQLVVKTRDRTDLLKIIANLPANHSYDIDPIDLM